MLSKRRVESVRPDDPILEIPWEKLSEIGSESSLGLSLKNSLNRFLRTSGETSLLDDLYQSVLHGLDNLDGSGAFLGFLTHPDVSYRGKSPQSIQNKLARSELPTAFRRVGFDGISHDDSFLFQRTVHITRKHSDVSLPSTGISSRSSYGTLGLSLNWS